jgi:hypothetical protein
VLIPIVAWAAAAAVAVVVLGFCGYEVIWKANRLRRDVARLQVAAAQLIELRDGLAAAQQRVTAARVR